MRQMCFSRADCICCFSLNYVLMVDSLITFALCKGRVPAISSVCTCLLALFLCLDLINNVYLSLPEDLPTCLCGKSPFYKGRLMKLACNATEYLAFVGQT